ncbi:MAG: DUF1343 domain-containing protein [Bacteroidales bacterium]
MHKFFLTVLLIFMFTGVLSQDTTVSFPDLVPCDKITPGSEQVHRYLPMIRDKRAGIAANHTSLVGKTHLVDTLLDLNIAIEKIFAPEHGFRGILDAGKNIRNSRDRISGIQIISLYGKHYKPTQRDLRNIEIMIFDMQDVGVRFYTYLSTMIYIMEACAENDIPLIILDRPNPNGFYIDGPVLEKEFRSFVGLHPVPVVYGMTLGEYARMANGEKWLAGNLQCDLTVIPLTGYNHKMICKLPINPSPNLPNWISVYLYPSLALFEGTIMSVGRGTGRPFQVIGHPGYLTGSFMFMPEARPGANDPKYQGEVCYGSNLTSYALNFKNQPGKINLHWLKETYRYFGKTHRFFNSYFNYLAGNSTLQEQIRTGTPADTIRNSWRKDIEAFKKIRKQYLLYEDFPD